MKQLDAPMQYNYFLWMTHYLHHLGQIETLHNIGDPTELGFMEMRELHPEVSNYNDGQAEIGNLAPSDYVENPIPTRIATQFSWGSRYCPPFTHSNDSITSVVASLAKLGKWARIRKRGAAPKRSLPLTLFCLPFYSGIHFGIGAFKEFIYLNWFVFKQFIAK